MGLVRVGPPAELVEKLVDRFGISVFVETGTHHGATAEWAAGLFERVVTIEASAELHARAARRLAHLPNVEARLGDSAAVLGGLVPTLDRPALFWLDAHWSGDGTAGSAAQCPLVGELEAVGRARRPPYVLIDDARMFLSPAPPPNDPQQWPSLRTVFDLLRLPGLTEPAVAEDVVIAVPEDARSVLYDHCVRCNGRVWDEHLRRSAPSLRGGVSLVREGVGLAVGGLRSRLGAR